MSDDQRRSRMAPAQPGARYRVTVLRSFTLTAFPSTPAADGPEGAAVALGADARRVIAYLAVHPRPQERVALAADLWPGVPPAAGQRLLSEAAAAVGVPALFNDPADPTDPGEPGGPLALAADVEVDLADALELVRAIPETPVGDSPDIALLSADILPDWT